MANYNLVIDSRFNPFSFEELIKPFQIYGEAYREQQNTLSELATQANVWNELADEQSDPYAYGLYKSFSDDLERQAEDIAKNGLSPLSRQNMLNMRQRYASDIIPIEQAYTRRKELIDEQRKLLAQDNTLMFDKNASSLSLDDLIRNPQLSYQSYSGANLAKQVGVAAQNLAKQMRENPRQWSSILGGQYFQTMMRNGYTPEEIILAAQDNKNAPQELRKIVSDAIDSSGIASWNDQVILNRAYDYAREGLWNAIGNTQYQVQSNKAYDYMMQNWLEGERDRRRNAQQGNSEPESSINLGVRIPLGTSGEVSEEVKRLEGLRPTPNGPSTIRLDNIRRKMEDLQKKLDDTTLKYNIDEINKYNERKDKGFTSRFEAAPPKGYAEVMRAQRNLDKARRDYDEELTFIATYADRYKHLSSDPYEALSIGRTLEDIQEKHQNSTRPLIGDPTDINKVKDVFKGILNSLSKEEVDEEVAGFVDEDGDHVSYKDMKNILKEFDDVSIGVLDKGTKRYSFTHNGKRYTLKNIEPFDNAEKMLNVTDSYLRDFSSNILNEITPITQEDLEDIRKNGIFNTYMRSRYNLQPVMIEINGEPVNTGYYGTTLYNAETGEFIKVLMDSNYNPVAENSLSDELVNKGENRDRYFLNMSNKMLNGLNPFLVGE